MGSRYQALIQKYRSLFDQINEIETKLTNLRKTDGQISEERYMAQESEYQNILDELRPPFDELTLEIKSIIDKLRNQLDDIEREMEPLREEIQQEDKLFKAGAISKNKYYDKVRPLKRVQKLKLSKCRATASQIKKLTNLLNNKDKPKIISRAIPKGDLKKDFFTGFGTIFFAIIVLVVGIPLFFFTLKAGSLLAIPVIIITLMILLVATFGRIINFVREKW